MKGLSLIVPVHNGEGFIKSSLREYHSFFSRSFNKIEIIAICNACKDNTFRECEFLKNEIPMKVLDVPRRGKGYALIEGFSHAKYELVGFLDADNPFDLNEILKMINSLEEADAIIATKFKKGRLKFQTSFLRRTFSLSAAIVSKIIFGLNVRDTQAGAKFIKKQALDRIKNNFVCGGFEFDIELLYRLKKKNAKIKEYFILPKDSDFSTVKMRILPGMLCRLLKLRFLK